MALKRRAFLKQFGVLTAASVSLLSGCSRRKKPNIVFVMADDLGWSQVGCYGSQYYETPNMNRLAAQGMKFTDAYAAAPVCSPTRASIMTGKYPARLHLTDFISGNPDPQNSTLLQPDWTKYLALDEFTMGEAMKQAGYQTALFGKWHLSKEKLPPESESHNPDKQGFDQSFVTYKPVPRMAKAWQTPENDAHNVQKITDKSLKFIEANKDQPFFLFVSHNSVHTPIVEKQSLIEKYKSKPGSDLPENNPVLGAMIETLDNSVGRIMEKLQDLDLADDTVFIFYSDNGGLERAADQEPLRAGKAALYEGGIRVPLIVKWPGQIRPGSTCKTPVISIDFYPTFAEIAGRDITDQTRDGISLIPLLTETGAIKRDALYWHYPHYHTSGVAPSGAIRRGKYKLIEWFEHSIDGIHQPGAVELYDLEQDISEDHNLAAENPERVSKLHKKLKTWRTAVGAQDMKKRGQ
ncbi:MAG: sulfatase [candidate division KSB1 bacterium]|nr:sulfatase [candidate division KSB1 bacterium]